MGVDSAAATERLASELPEYEYTQENLELMILLQCDDTFPVFIDNVTVNYAT
jgi:hypothetical protein